MNWKLNKLTTAVSLASVVGLGASPSVITAADRSEELAQRIEMRGATDTAQDLSDRRLDQPINISSGARSAAAEVTKTTGRQQVIVRLRGNPVSKHFDQSPAGRVSQKEQLKFEQGKFLKRAKKAAPSSKAMVQTQIVLNSVFLELNADEIEALAKDPDVVSINRVRDYRLYLPETVPYIGATALQDIGVDGSGVTVAVLDSGIDYYHQDLGGSGDVGEYNADNPDIIEPGTFPTAKVVGGFDFVGSQWPNGPLNPNPDPLDDGSASGHGTHVGDIIGGRLGVAPGADLIAVKVCSSVSTSCSGVALIQGMEFAVDPNGDGDPSDAVDVINMSLGSDYGQPFDDDLALAVNNASALGVLTVASAGNGGNKPYVNGTPAAAVSALSVAQTQVPSAVQPFLTLNGVDYPAVFQPWSVFPTSVVSGPLQYGDGAGGNLDGCAPFAPGSLDGFIVLVDRGSCSFTLKISNIGVAGGEAGIIGLIAPGDPFAGGDGGHRPIDIPGYMVSQAIADIFKDNLGETLTIDPDAGVSLVGQFVGSSSRGPQHESTNLIKPEIAAPGGSVSAIAGGGDATGPFGGTSGAAPMVSGSAALLLQGEPDLAPHEVKARLVNNAETEILTDPSGELAPITRIGGGEVRVDQAYNGRVAAWDRHSLQSALSFGFVDVAKNKINMDKTLVIHNFGEDTKEYDVTASFRYEEDADNGAVSLKVPAGKVRVRPGRDASMKVKMTIEGALLPGNSMSSGVEGANPAALSANEYDGYVTFENGSESFHVPWHVIPRKAAEIKARNTLKFKDGIDVITLQNAGVGTAHNQAYSLLAVSENLPEGGLGEQSPTPDIRAVGVNTELVGAGFCSAAPSFLWTFAINTWERQQHLLPVTHIVYLDIDQDGEDDYAVLNRDLSGLGTLDDGRQVAYAVNLSSGSASAFFFAEHAMNTGNTVLIVCAEQVGLTEADLLSTQVGMSVEAQDFYYGGPGDFVGDLSITPFGERYVGLPDDVPGNSKEEMTVLDFGAIPGNSEELGILLFTNSDRGAGERGGATKDTEALIFRAKNTGK